MTIHQFQKKEESLKDLKFYERICKVSSRTWSSISPNFIHCLQLLCHCQVLYPIHRSWVIANPHTMFSALALQANFIPYLLLLCQAKIYILSATFGSQPNLLPCLQLLGHIKTSHPVSSSWIKTKQYTLHAGLRKLPNFIQCLQPLGHGQALCPVFFLLGKGQTSDSVCSFAVTAKPHIQFAALGSKQNFIPWIQPLGHTRSQTLFGTLRSCF